ncbi:SDR family NAD(P)-dependent oxidoreductase [Chloroflexota bacterium]
MILKDKVALITGSGSGFGRAGALLFAREGAKVVVVDIEDEGGRETVAQINQAGGTSSYVHADVGIVAEIERMINKATETYSKLNIFWHNAGIAGPGIIEHTTEEAFDHTLDVHVKAGFFGSKYAIPEIKKAGGGVILFTTSVSGYKPSPFSPAYGISKAALSMLAKCLAAQLAKDNIRVNCIAPGAIKTGIWQGCQDRDPHIITPKEWEKTLLEKTPLGRFGKVDDVARAALYLVSDEASFITGIDLAVDGGWLVT